MTTARDVMTSDPHTLEETATIRDAARSMRGHHIGVVLMPDEQGTLTGLVTHRDVVVRGLAEDHAPDTELAALLDPADPAVVTPEDDLAATIAEMKRQAVKRVPVVDGDVPSDEALQTDVSGVRSAAAIKGRPLHPMLIPLPIGALTLALVTDVMFWAPATRSGRRRPRGC